MTHSYMRGMGVATRQEHTKACDMTRVYAWHDLLICVTCLIHAMWQERVQVCDMTFFINVTWLFDTWHDSLICVRWLIYMCERLVSWCYMNMSGFHVAHLRSSVTHMHSCFTHMHSYAWHNSHIWMHMCDTVLWRDMNMSGFHVTHMHSYVTHMHSYVCHNSHIWMHTCDMVLWCYMNMSGFRPTQSVMYVPLQVNGLAESILLIIQYRYLKSCSGDFYSPESDPPHKIMRYWF